MRSLPGKANSLLLSMRHMCGERGLAAEKEQEGQPEKEFE